MVDAVPEPEVLVGGAGDVEALRLLDQAGIAGELVLRELRTGRVETVQMWGRGESVRQEFKRIRSQ